MKYPSFAAAVMAAAAVVTACSRAEPSRSAEPATETAPLGRSAVAQAPTPNDAHATRPRIVVLGDSLTAGLGLPSTHAYPTLLQRYIDAEGLGFEVVNAGVSGDTSAGGLRRLDWSLAGDVRVLVVALGGNDGLRGLPVAELERNLRAIIERGKAKGAAVVLAGMEAPPNFGPEYTAAFRQVYRTLAEEQHVPLLPFLLEGVAGEASLNQGDGIHPNAAGAEIVARHVWHTLAPLLERRRS